MTIAHKSGISESWPSVVKRDLAKIMADQYNVGGMLAVLDWTKPEGGWPKPKWKTPRMAEANVFRLWAYIHGENCVECGY